ncbi:MAG: aldose 1-epimerase [Lentisphaerae bacterium]|nr:aldose 1-epimerase [Lentisphaerota bacterium]
MTIETITNVGSKAQIIPEYGANLVSFQVDGIEFIHWNGHPPKDDEDWSGAFNMFPTPCRLANCSYSFEGKHITQKKHNQDVFIHGLVRDELMQYKNNGSSIVSWLNITPGHPVYEGFPFKCMFTLTHTLDEYSLTVGFKVENRDKCNIPFGYGLHPFWQIYGERKDISIRIPCDKFLDLDNLVPTGGSTSVKGTDYDLRTLRNINNLFVDNVYCSRQPGDTAEIHFASIQKKLIIAASDNFRHIVVFIPHETKYFCVENLTTCPNAPNLVNAGHGDVATMLVVAPGQTIDGWIKYKIETI